jgi:hypothetical protein
MANPRPKPRRVENSEDWLECLARAGPLRKALPLLELSDGAAMMLEATSEELS